MTQNTNPSTFIEAVVSGLEAALRNNPGESVAPSAVLWPDGDGQWMPVVQKLKTVLPHLFVYGEYDPEKRTGPAIWLKCVVARTLRNMQLADDVTPILYLPNLSRQTLRAVESCPDELKPLVELQYRGTTWCQRNGKDWTVEAFLVSEDGGLGLDVSRDTKTQRGILGALTELCGIPLQRLRGKRLEAEDFERLLVDDTPRDVLVWMNDPEGVRADWGPEKWNAFCSRCSSELRFRPDTEGDIVAGERLGRREGVWAAVWERYEESPRLYPNIPHLLSRSKPPELLFLRETWPDENDRAEETLRSALMEVGARDAESARKRILELEAEHGERRGWVWSRLDRAPLAHALKHLALLGAKSEHAIAGTSLEDMVATYNSEGYAVDLAVLDALSRVKKEPDLAAVGAAIKALYVPWLDQTARNLQLLLTAQSAYPEVAAQTARAGECILFVDGLRLDVAKRLAELLAGRDWRMSADIGFAALPTVTATSKHAVSPIANGMEGPSTTATFAPLLDGSEIAAPAFRKGLEAAGYQVLLGTELGAPGPDKKAWAEYGEFDSLGHKLQSKLVGQIQPQLELLADRIASLIDGGWDTVKVITDHGWLLVPGGLSVVPLSKHVTDSRWTRCAALKTTAQTAAQTAPWFWNDSVHFAYAPGASAYAKGNEYAHGGVSLQECALPLLTIAANKTFGKAMSCIADIQWLRLRCRVATEGATSSCVVDVRTRVADASSSLMVDKAPRALDNDGRVGFTVEDDMLEGTAAVVVLLDAQGNVLAKRSTTIGGEE